jgi:hypothetical protein
MIHAFDCECTDCQLLRDREDEIAAERLYERNCEAEREQEREPRPRTL